jgi:O-acetylserine/cysteine efflux transporter
VSAFCYALATIFACALRTPGAFAMNGWMAVSGRPLLTLLSLFRGSGQLQTIATAGWLRLSLLLHSALVV